MDMDTQSNRLSIKCDQLLMLLEHLPSKERAYGRIIEKRILDICDEIDTRGRATSENFNDIMLIEMSLLSLLGETYEKALYEDDPIFLKGEE